MAWAAFPKEAPLAASSGNEMQTAKLKPPFAVQLVRQVNFGPVEDKQYFMPLKEASEAFVEVMEDDVLQANFQKLNS